KTATLTPTQTPNPCAGFPASCVPNDMAIDADANTAGIDAARVIVGIAPFTLAANIDLVPHAYQGYEIEVSWPTDGLALVGTPAQLQPRSLVLCQTATTTTDGANTVFQDACARSIGTTTFTGAVETFDLQCMATGTFVVHLVPVAEDPLFGTAAL